MNLTTALGIFFRPSRSIISLIPAALLLAAVSASGEYHNFNTTSGSDGIIQEVRWRYWAESTYNAIYNQTLSGSDEGLIPSLL